MCVCVRDYICTVCVYIYTVFMRFFFSEVNVLEKHHPIFKHINGCVFLCVSQSRVPGTVIPLCAAQCERMFNTTRIPGDETGNTGAAHLN